MMLMVKLKRQNKLSLNLNLKFQKICRLKRGTERRKSLKMTKMREKLRNYKSKSRTSTNLSTRKRIGSLKNPVEKMLMKSSDKFKMKT
jgi:hypothetical protein